MTSGSATWSPVVRTGLSEVIGSWKIIAISVAAHLPHLALGQRQQIAAAEEHAAADDAAGRIAHQAQDRQRGHRLAAARFADDAERCVPAGTAKQTPSTARSSTPPVAKRVTSSTSRSGSLAAARLAVRCRPRAAHRALVGHQYSSPPQPPPGRFDSLARIERRLLGLASVAADHAGREQPLDVPLAVRRRRRRGWRSSSPHCSRTSPTRSSDSKRAPHSQAYS